MPDVSVGAAILCAKWFKEVGLQGKSGRLAGLLKQDYVRMVRFLEKCFGRIIAPGIISTVEEAVRAAQKFRKEKIDALLIVHIMWSEDPPLLEILKECRDLPILIWNYHPTGRLPAKLQVNDLFRFSGTVGMLQGSAPLRRAGLAVRVVSGSPGDICLARTLREYDTALKIRKGLRNTSAGRIAGRCEIMTGTWVNPGLLLKTFGVRLIEISAKEYALACENISSKRVNAYYADLIKRFPVKGVSEKSLKLACRNTLALDDLVRRHNLMVVAIQDLDEDLHRLAGARPCLCPPDSIQRGTAFGMESDLNTALGMRVAMQACHKYCMFTEIFTFDPKKNTLLMGHAGVHDPRLAAGGKVTIVPDEEYRHTDRAEGAWQEFVLAQGPVTCISLYDTGKAYRMVAFEGQSLGAPRRLQGFAHALVRTDVPVNDLLARLVQRGMTQHFMIAPGCISSIMAKWCWVNKIEFCLEE